MENFDYSTLELQPDTDSLVFIDYEDDNGELKQEIIQIREGMNAKYVYNPYGEVITISNNYSINNRVVLRDVQALLRGKKISKIEYELVLEIVPDNLVSKVSFIFGTKNEEFEKGASINYLVDSGENNTYEILTIQLSTLIKTVN